MDHTGVRELPEGFTVVDETELPKGFQVIEDKEASELPEGFKVIGGKPATEVDTKADWEEPESIGDPDIRKWRPPSVSVEEGKLIFKQPGWWAKVGSDIKRELIRQSQEKLAEAEIPLALVGGFLSMGPAGIAGLGTAIAKKDLAKGEEAIEKVGTFLTHQPTAEIAKSRLETLTKPLRWIHEASRFYGDIAYKKTGSANIAATVATAFELAAYAALARIVKTGKAKPAQKGKPLVTTSQMQAALDTIKSEGGEAGQGAKIVKELIEKDAKPFKEKPTLVKPEKVTVTFASRYRPHLEQLKERVQQGEPGKRIKVAGTEEWKGLASTYPDFMKGQGWAKIEVEWSLHKGLRGEKLTLRQAEMFEAALSEAKDIYRYDLKGVKEIRAAEPVVSGELEVGQKFKYKEKIWTVTEKTGEGVTIKEPSGITAKHDVFYEFEGAKMLVRDISSIAKDANVLLGEEGAISFRKTKLTPEQLAAQERLAQDAALLKEKSKQAGKEFQQYLIDEGIPANMARAITEFSLEKGVPQKKQIPKYAGAINLEKISIEDSLKRLESTIGKARPRKVQTWDKTQELSREILKDQEQSAHVLARAKAGEALTAEQIQATRQINVNAIDRLKEMAEELPYEKFNEQFKVYVEDIFNSTSDASSAIGRALNAHKIEVSVNRMAKSFTKLEKGLNKRQLEDFKKLNLEDVEGVKAFLDKLPDPKLKDYFYEYWYNSILSGVPTHVVNVVSNTLWSAFQIPHRVVAGTIDRMITTIKPGRQRQVFVNEVLPMLAGYRTGAAKGIKAAGELLRFGKATQFESKWLREIGHSLGAFERSPYRALRIIGKAITPPTKALRVMDVFANSIAFDGQLRALARRAANQRGLKPGKAREVFEENFLKDVPPEAMKEALAFGKYTTFMSDPGKFSQWVIKGREVIPGGRLIVPFVNTIGKLLQRGVEMTPGIGLTLAKGKVPAEVIAKQIEGAILSLYILHKCDKGEITGQWPDSLNERKAWHRQGKKAWSIQFGDIWYSYRRIEPFATPIAIVAIAHDKLKNAKDDETATEIFMDTARAVKEFILDASYLQMMGRIFDKYGRIEGVVQRMAASFTPYSSFWRSINRAYEVATEGQARVRESASWLGAFATVIPGLSGKMPARLDVWGEEIEMPGGVFRQWLPYKWSEETTDKVELELKRLEIYPGLPGQMLSIDGKMTKLDNDVYRNYCIAFGHDAKAAITKMIGQPGYKSKPDEIKIRILDDIIANHRNKYINVTKAEQRRRIRGLK